MKNMGLITKLLGGQSIWLLLGVALAAASSGFWLGDALQQRETLKVRTELSQYQAEVSKSVGSGNVKVLSALKGLAKSLEQLQAQMQGQQAIDQTFSDNLIKELYRANDGTSCPLSPALRSYLDSLRNRTFTP